MLQLPLARRICFLITGLYLLLTGPWSRATYHEGVSDGFCARLVLATPFSPVLEGTDVQYLLLGEDGASTERLLLEDARKRGLTDSGMSLAHADLVLNRGIDFVQSVHLNAHLNSVDSATAPIVWRLDLSRISPLEFQALLTDRLARHGPRGMGLVPRALRSLMQRTVLTDPEPFLPMLDPADFHRHRTPFLWIEGEGGDLERIFQTLADLYWERKPYPMAGDPDFPKILIANTVAHGTGTDGTALRRVQIAYNDPELKRPITLMEKTLSPEGTELYRRHQMSGYRTLKAGDRQYTFDLREATFMDVVSFERILERIGYPAEHPLRQRFAYFRRTYLASLRI